MAETIVSGAHNQLDPGHLPPSGGDIEGGDLRESQYTVEELRAMYDGYLERRDVDPARVPHLTMGRREFDVMRNAPGNYLGYIRKQYGLVNGDQEDGLYTLIEIGPDDINQPHDPVLITVVEADFGTTIGPKRIAKDFQSADSNPDGPVLPEFPGGAYRTVDISNTLTTSAQGLQAFAAELMGGDTTDPLSGLDGDIGIRAGGLAEGQKDAYVWTTTPFTKSVELTIAFPGTYSSVCIVRGQTQEAGNGKPGMAQIVDPTEVLRIEGESLAELQRIYKELYHEPNFALTDAQRRVRDETFNSYLAQQISNAASENRSAEREQKDYEERRRRESQPQVRYLRFPYN